MDKREPGESRKAASRANGAKSHTPVTPECKHNAGPTTVATTCSPAPSCFRVNPAKGFRRQFRRTRASRIISCLALEADAGFELRNASPGATPADSDASTGHALALLNSAQSGARLSTYEIACDCVFARSLDRLIQLCNFQVESGAEEKIELST